MMSCAYVISRFGPSITRLAGRTRPERWENAYELRKSGQAKVLKALSVDTSTYSKAEIA